MTKNQETQICPPQVKDLTKYALNKINLECSNLIGRNFGISKPSYEIISIEEFLDKNEGKYYLINSEFEDSYEGHIYNIFTLTDVIKIVGSLLGSDDNAIKEMMKKEELNADYLDGASEFGNQFSGVLDNGFRGKLPKPVHIKIAASTPLDKDNLKNVFENYSDCDCLHLSSLLLIKGFETGKFGMFIPLDLVEDFYGEELHEKGTNVLILDDSQADIRSLRRYLANTEFKVLPATCANDAFTILHKEKIHLILIDLNMPEISGIDVCKKLKKTPYTKGIPVLMVSGRPTETSVMESLEAGARDFIVKPYQKEVLLKKISRFKSKKKRQELIF